MAPSPEPPDATVDRYVQLRAMVDHPGTPEPERQNAEKRCAALRQKYPTIHAEAHARAARTDPRSPPPPRSPRQARPFDAQVDTDAIMKSLREQGAKTGAAFRGWAMDTLGQATDRALTNMRGQVLDTVDRLTRPATDAGPPPPSPSSPLESSMPRRRTPPGSPLGRLPIAQILADHTGLGGVTLGMTDEDGDDHDLVVVAVYMTADAVSALLNKAEDSPAAAKKIGELVLACLDETATDGEVDWPFNELTEFNPDAADSEDDDSDEADRDDDSDEVHRGR